MFYSRMSDVRCLSGTTIINLVSLFIKMDLLSETIRGTKDRIKASKKYKSLISDYTKSNETSIVSPEIKITEKRYRVIIFTNNLISLIKSKSQPTGLLIVNEKEIEPYNEELCIKILKIYSVWFYNYYHRTFKKNVYAQNKLFKLIKNIRFDLTSNIGKRVKEGYDKQSEMYGEKYSEILEKLDNQVLKHQEILELKTNLISQMIDLEVRGFEDLSYELLEKRFSLINEIRILSIKENAIWTERYNIWGDYIKILEKVKKSKKVKKHNPFFEVVFQDIIGLFLRWIPFQGTSYFLLKIGANKLKQKSKEWYLHDFLQHKLGLDAIKKNIDQNIMSMEKLNIYSEIIENTALKLIRTKPTWQYT
jgi:hypothetical protein